MSIKNRVKISFLAIIVSVFLIAAISIVVTFQIRKNSFLNNQISQIILLQERMNQAIQDLTYSYNIKKVDELKNKFNHHELEFEKIKKTILLNENPSFFSRLLKESQEQKTIIEDLKELFLNEHKIEVTFSKMYLLQEKHIEMKKTFDYLYPKEKKERYNLYTDISKKENFKSMHYFGLVQYYSKENLYQHQTQNTLSKWLDVIIQTKNTLADPITLENLAKYKTTATKIGTTAINIQNSKNSKIKLQTKINSVLQRNKALAINISKMIEQISTNTTDKLFLILLVLSIFIALFITIFGFKISKNIGFSVDQIEDKVQDGLKQITQLNKEIESTQQEVVFTMGTIAEYRSKETGNHVKRVAKYSEILALHYGLDKKEAELLGQASPMHDIGKVAIPDAVLNKPGRFNEEERAIMNEHALLGYKMLNTSERPLLKTASIVAYEHHEKWDGTGYPRGLKGENIHIYGRITALADVFDALGSDRVYKKAWNNEKIYKLFKEERGKHFEPKLIDIFFDNLDEFLKVQSTFKD